MVFNLSRIARLAESKLHQSGKCFQLISTPSDYVPPAYTPRMVAFRICAFRPNRHTGRTGRAGVIAFGSPDTTLLAGLNRSLPGIGGL